MPNLYQPNGSLCPIKRNASRTKGKMFHTGTGMGFEVSHPRFVDQSQNHKIYIRHTVRTQLYEQHVIEQVSTTCFGHYTGRHQVVLNLLSNCTMYVVYSRETRSRLQ